MNVAIAGTLRRQPRRRHLAILALATLAHALVLFALIRDARWTPVMVEAPTIEAELIRPHAPPPPTPTEALSKPVAPIAAAPAPPSPVIHAPPAVAKPSGPPGIVAPPGFTARKLVEESEGTQKSLRDSLKCRHEKDVALTKTEKAACAEADGERSRTAPTYAAIDPAKKAAFDGDCAKDDEWCQYRIGKGPYPGIFALGKKKKRPGWDD